MAFSCPMPHSASMVTAANSNVPMDMGSPGTVLLKNVTESVITIIAGRLNSNPVASATSQPTAPISAVCATESKKAASEQRTNGEESDQTCQTQNQPNRDPGQEVAQLRKQQGARTQDDNGRGKLEGALQRDCREYLAQTNLVPESEDAYLYDLIEDANRTEGVEAGAGLLNEEQPCRTGVFSE